jgi:hypothetical protein
MEAAMWKIGLLFATLLAWTPGLADEASLDEVGTIKVPKEKPYKDAEDNFDQSHNMSGLFCETDWCLMVSDEKLGLHRLKIKRDHDGNPKVSHASIFALDLPSDVKELDLEAIAAKDDKVIFVGSHANKRGSGKPNPSSHLVAVASIADLKSKTKVPAEWVSLDKLFGKHENILGKVLYKKLQCGGLNIEGATVVGGELLIGLRSPTRGADGVNPAAYVVSTPLDKLLDEDFSGSKVHVLPTGRPFIGIRAMETVGQSVVVVTGDGGVSDIKDDDGNPIAPGCGAGDYENKEDLSRPFELRVWKPEKGDAFEAAPRIEFPEVKEPDFEGKKEVAKLEAIAADPARPGAFFILYDGSDKVRYLTGVDIP